MTGVRAPRRSQEDRSAATVGRLLAAARTLFGAHGFADTSTEAVIAAAGVTRGALYHHFPTKHALFAAVVDQIQAEIGEAIAATPTPAGGDRWDRLLVRCEAFLLASRREDVRRILLRDAPAVIGAAAWNAGDERHAAHRLRAAFRALALEGRLGTLDPEMLAVMVNGALNDATFRIAGSADPERAVANAIAALRALIDGLRRQAPAPG